MIKTHAARLHSDARQKFLGPKIKILLDNLVEARAILTRGFEILKKYGDLADL